MYFYEVALLSSPLSLLTYSSALDLKIGRAVEVSLRNKVYKAVIISSSIKPDFQTSEVLEVTESYYSKEQLDLAAFISTYYNCSIGESLGLMVAYVTGKDSHTKRENEINAVNFQSKITLSDKQQKALKFLQEHKISLLFGDTGSGKTEIYMKYFELMIAQGKRSIFLMPEISLTPQMSQRLEEHFGEKVVMWHSKLTPLQKRKALEKIYDGTAFILAGPRSALFLPIEDLGLIVVDEEHD
ncbi:DEAD/DEAH box helicase, partial [bacterium]|nr:DEAD/DEAH box helicase [bacterium]